MSLFAPFFQKQETPIWVLELGILLSQQEDHSIIQTADYHQCIQHAHSQSESYLSLQPHQVRESIETLLLQKNPGVGLQFLQESKLLKSWLPEVDALVNLSEESEQLHKDVWEHTKQVVMQAIPTPLVRWAALLHDIGKVPTRTINPDGSVHFYRHSEVGAVMFQKTAPRLQFKPEQQKALFMLIEQHLRPNLYLSSWTDSAVRRFAKEAGAYLTELLALSRADITSKIPGKRERAWARLDELTLRIQTIQAQDSKEPPLPKGFGQELMKKFSLPASALIGQIKKKIEQEIEEGRLEAHQQMEYYLMAAKDFLPPAPHDSL